MKMLPNRIALVALLLLVLVAGVSWWLMQARQQQAGFRPEAEVSKEAMYEAGEASSPELAARSPSGPCGTALVDALDDHARALLQRQDSVSQLAYAFTAPSGELPDPKRVREAEYQRAYTRAHLEQEARVNAALLRAHALAPDDPDVRWLAAVHCGNDDTCTGPRKALTVGEADNMAVWLRELAWARQRGDPVAAQHAFVAAAGAPRYETHSGAEQEVILASYGDLPLPPACATPEGTRELRALSPRGGGDLMTMLDMALLRAQSVKFQSQPILRDLQDRCGREGFAHLNAAAQGHCWKILTRLATQNSPVERGLALDLMVQLSVGSPDASRWRHRYREHQWLMEQMADNRVQALLQPEDYWSGEVDAVQAALELAGLWPPPEDWLPRDERARSLILTGRPPESRR